MKILHIIPDDKFWRPIIAIFDRLEVENEYVCIVKKEGRRFKYIDSERIIAISEEQSVFLWKREDVDAYVFHSIPPINYDRILTIRENRIIAVVSWGYDIYYSLNGCPPLVYVDLYKPMTIKLLKQMHAVPFFLKAKRFIKRIVLNKRYRELVEDQRRMVRNRVETRNNALGRIDYWATVLPNEYDMIKNGLGIKARYMPFHYSGTSQSTIFPQIDVNRSFNILVGNSADPSNNHIDVVSVIRARGIENKLYLPMAYGDNLYRDRVREYLKSHAVESEIQNELMPIGEYRQKLLNCRVAIFGHIRQQAVGNIMICMRSGMKVFLFKDSVAFKFFKSIGSFVFSIEDELTKEEIRKPLTEKEKEVNIRNLGRFSIEGIIDRLGPIIGLMKKDTNSRIDCGIE